MPKKGYPNTFERMLNICFYILYLTNMQKILGLNLSWCKNLRHFNTLEFAFILKIWI